MRMLALVRGTSSLYCNPHLALKCINLSYEYKYVIHMDIPISWVLETILTKYVTLHFTSQSYFIEQFRSFWWPAQQAVLSQNAGRDYGAESKPQFCQSFHVACVEQSRYVHLNISEDKWLKTRSRLTSRDTAWAYVKPSDASHILGFSVLRVWMAYFTLTFAVILLSNILCFLRNNRLYFLKVAVCSWMCTVCNVADLTVQYARTRISVD